MSATTTTNNTNNSNNNTTSSESSTSPVSPNSNDNSPRRGVRDLAKSGISYAKHFHPWLNYSISNIELFASTHIPETVKTQLNAAGDKVDNKVFEVLDKSSEIKANVENKVESVKSTVNQMKSLAIDSYNNPEQALQSMKQFYEHATIVFMDTIKQANNNRETFVNNLKAKMGQMWSDKLVEPAHLFYEKAINMQKNTKEQFENKLNTTMQAASETTQTYYNMAIQTYNNLYTKAIDRKVKGEEFINEMKSRLGSAYNDKLYTPLMELYTNIHNQTTNKINQLTQPHIEAIKLSVNNNIEKVKTNLSQLQVLIQSNEKVAAATNTVTQLPTTLQSQLQSIQSAMSNIVNKSVELKDEYTTKSINAIHSLFNELVSQLQSTSIKVLGEEREKKVEQQLKQTAEMLDEILAKIRTMVGIEKKPENKQSETQDKTQ